MKRFLVIALLSGCSAAQVQQDELRSAHAAITEACKAGFQAAAMDPIRQKVPALAPGGATLLMLADASYATDAERPAILALDAAAVDCINRRIALANANGASDYAAVDAAALTDAQQNRLALYQGKITWGQYATKSKEVADQARGMMAALNDRRRNQAINQQAANAQSAGAAAAMMRATQPVFQPIQPITLQPTQPRPVNCTSIRQGVYTTTNCQ